jgi:Ca-activated chloride channel homolog
MRTLGLVMKSVAPRWFLAMALCGILPFPIVAQTIGPEVPIHHKGDTAKDTSKPIQIDVSLVLINMTVTDPNDRLVTGLEKENFRVFEDGKEQEIATFSSEDTPISIGVIFDMSGSMSDKIGRARQAAVQFLRTANPRDEFFMVSFNDRANLTSPFTSSVDELQNRMMFTAARGQTALLDAIYLGLSQMRSASNGKRALLVISDGGDNHSRYNERDIRNFLKEADCQLYAMGVFDVNDLQRTDEERYGPTLLSELAEMTGGRVFAAANLNDLPDIAAKISLELRNQYVLGYKPSDARRNGTWRKIKVKLMPPKGLPPLSVYARTGYRAPTD